MTVFAVNNSEVPIVRAGSSNLVWPIIAIALFMLVRASELPPSGRLTISAFLLLTITLGIWLFVTTVARVTFSDDAIDILRAITRETIRYEEVDFVELTRMRLTPLLRIRIKLKTPERKLQLNVRGPYTPWGSLVDSSKRFRSVLESRGVRVIER